MTEVKISLTEYATLKAVVAIAEQLKIAAMENDLVKIPELVASLDRAIEAYNDVVAEIDD